MRAPALVVAVAAALLGVAPAAGQAATPNWVTAWAGNLHAPGALSVANPFFSDAGGRTIRNVVRPSIGGTALRVRLSNTFGSAPVTFDDVRVGVSAGSGAVVAGSGVQARFGGRTRVTVAVGKQVVSDVVTRSVTAGRALAVTVHTTGAVPTTTTSGTLLHTSYLSDAAAGDVAASESAAPFTATARLWYFVSGVDVVAPARVAGSVVALGASITAGVGSDPDTYASWPDLIAPKLASAARAHPLSLLNLGISGNNLHESSSCYGQSGVARFDRDVLGQAGVRAVVLDLGVNDITQPHQERTGLVASCLTRKPISAGAMIALYEAMIAKAHRHGLKIIGATLTPFGAYVAWSPAIEREWLAINRWMLSSGAFDGVVDFAKALADPAGTPKLNPAFDSGDHLHPNAAGHRALARAVPLSLFAGVR